MVKIKQETLCSNDLNRLVWGMVKRPFFFQAASAVLPVKKKFQQDLFTIGKKRHANLIFGPFVEETIILLSLTKMQLLMLS